MVDDLKTLGVELMVSAYSHSVGKASHNYAEAESKHYLATDRNGQPAATVGPGFTYDLFQPAARGSQTLSHPAAFFCGRRCRSAQLRWRLHLRSLSARCPSAPRAFAS